MKKILENKKNVFLIIGLALVIILVVSLIVIYNIGQNQETKLKSSLKSMGRKFYEDFYYEKIANSDDERKTFLEKFTSIGIKVDLDNLERYNNGANKEEVEKFINNKTKEKCNKTNTKIVIYPQSPYGKTDYKLEAILDCGFEEDKKDTVNK